MLCYLWGNAHFCIALYCPEPSGKSICCVLTVVLKLIYVFEEWCLSESEGSLVEVC